MCSSTDTASNSKAYSSTDAASNSRSYSRTDTASNSRAYSSTDTVRETNRRNLHDFELLCVSQCNMRSV